MFADLDSASGLVVQLLNDLGIAGARDLLRPEASDLLRRLVERFADVDLCLRKSVFEIACGFVRDVLDTSAGLVEQLVFPALQALVSARSALVFGLLAHQTGEFIVAPLNRRLCLASTDQHSSFTVRRRDQRVHAQIDANSRFG